MSRAQGRAGETAALSPTYGRYKLAVIPANAGYPVIKGSPEGRTVFN